MKPIDFHPDAAEEARDAARYYEKARDGLGVEFRDEVAALLARIQENPQLYAIEEDGIRIGIVDRFPYAVYYEEMEDRIGVAAVAHQHRRPGYWKHRRSSS